MKTIFESSKPRPEVLLGELSEDIFAARLRDVVEGNAFERLILQHIDLPQRATRAEYAKEIVTNYPFHPELLTTLNRKTSTIPNFQKTRGAWNRYKRVKTLTDAFGQEATKISVKMTLRADFPDGLEVDNGDYQTIRDIFTTLGMGKLTVDAEPSVYPVRIANITPNEWEAVQSGAIRR